MNLQLNSAPDGASNAYCNIVLVEDGAVKSTLINIVRTSPGSGFVLPPSDRSGLAHMAVFRNPFK